MKQMRWIGWGIAVGIPLAFLVFFFAFPVGAMLARGLYGATEAVGNGTDAGSARIVENSLFTGLCTLLTDGYTWQIIWQTVWMALAGTLLSVFFGIPGAYALYRLDFPGKKLIRGIIAMPFVLPTVVVGIAFSAVFRGPLAFLRLENSVWAVVLAMLFFNFSVIVRMVGNMWQGLDERMSQAARTLGASPLRAFITVTLPQLAPAVAAGAGVVFLYCSTAYGIVTTLGNPGYGTLETEIYRQTAIFFNLDQAAMLSVLQFLIVAISLLVSSRLTVHTETALKIKARSYHRVYRADWWAFGLTLSMVAFILLPLVTLLIRSLQADGKWSIRNYLLLSEPGAGFAGGTSVWEAVEHSVKIAGDATLITFFIGVPLALVLSRRVRGAWAQAQQLLDAFVLLPLGVSTVTVGFGFLIAFSGSAIGDSPLLVPLAQAVVALPLFIRLLVPSLRAIDPRMREAARTLGATPWQVLRTIDLPYLLRGLGLALGFAFAISLGEFGATSFLANPDYLTLPVVIVKLLSRPGADNYGMALAGAMILAFGTGLIMVVAELVGAQGSEESRAR
ncbi:ABC transporter permease [Arcanobacterium hippocoleae]|uniref:Thiamine transport system permease protein n=2 Tax=Arcanobacterium hippocoleae TaxID=149017 RepID=A0ABU1T2R3_9ACTO|nr:thiamine transport system permease protein [Arcanobacterium hippocoleae]